MKPTKPVKDLLDKEMSRQEFLKVAGLGALSVFGAGNIISYLSSHSPQQKQNIAKQGTMQKATHGFGSRKFGV